MRTQAFLTALLAFSLLSDPAIAAPGDLDPAFGTGGKVTMWGGQAYRSGRAIAVQPDDKYLVAAVASGWETFASPLFRFNTDHSLDMAYGYKGVAMVQGLVNTVTMQGGLALTAEMSYRYEADQTTFELFRDTYIARYLANGFPDTSFGTGGRSAVFNPGSLNEHRQGAIAIAPDGKIVTAGFATVAGGARQILVVRYTANGALDTTFNGTGWKTFAAAGTTTVQEATSLAVLADGRIMLAGTFGAPTLGFVARMLADGSGLDATFNGSGFNQISSPNGPVECHGLVQATASRTLVSCSYPVPGGNIDGVVAAFDAAGATDATWAVNLVDLGTAHDRFRSMALAGDGTLYVAGKGIQDRITVTAFQSTGALLTTFGSGGTFVHGNDSSGAWAIAVKGAQLVVTGERSLPPILGDASVAVLALDRAAGSLAAESFHKATSSQSYGAVKRLTDGRLLVGGTVGLLDAPTVATTKFFAGGMPDVTHGGFFLRSEVTIPSMDFLVGVRDMAVQPDGKALLAHDLGGFPANQMRLGASRLVNNGPDTTFNAAGTPGYNYAVSGNGSAFHFPRGVRLQSDGKILAVGSGMNGSTRQMAVARLNADGTIDATYGASGVAKTAFGAPATGRSMDIQADDKAVVLGNHNGNIVVARFTAAGALDTTFGSGGIATAGMPSGFLLNTPNRIMIRPTGKIVVMATVSTGTGAGNMTFQFTAGGLLDPGFTTGYIETTSGAGPNNSNAFGAVLTPNGKIVAVGIAHAGTTHRGAIVRFNANGSPDAGFGVGGVIHVADPFVRPEFANVDVDPDGSLYIVGNYSPAAERLGFLMKTVADPTAVTPPSLAKLRADFNNDGRADITYVDPSGQAAMWLMDGTTPIGSALLLGPSTGWSIARNDGDFNGDGFADLLWRNTDGRWAIWLMNGTSPIASGLVFGGGSGWEVTHLGDFDGDGKSDLAWKDATGQVAVWLMNGVAPAASAIVFAGGTTWQVTHVGDFDGDGKADLLFKDGGGQVSMWLMNGTAIAASGIVFGGGSFSVAKVGDFNGDGKTDLALTDSGNALALWLMDGLTVASSGLVYGGGAFQLTHAGDFDGNGKSDLLFKDAGGQVAVWLVDALTVTGSAIVFGGGGGWQVTHVADFDGDARTDLLWKDAGGQVAIWTMSGTSPTGSALIFGGGGGWVVSP